MPTLFEQAEKAEKDKKAEDNTEKSTQSEETKEPVENKPDVPVVKEDEAKVTETNSEDTAKIKPQTAEKKIRLLLLFLFQAMFLTSTR